MCASFTGSVKKFLLPGGKDGYTGIVIGGLEVSSKLVIAMEGVSQSLRLGEVGSAEEFRRCNYYEVLDS